MPRPRDFTPPRPWAPLSDDDWALLAPYLWRAGPGRPIEQPRRRLDAIFWLAAQHHRTRWADLPEHFGKPDTASRQFRRWAHGGLWHALLKALVSRHTPGRDRLRRLASWICRAYRRAWRVHGLAGVTLPKRLGLLSALRGPPWLLPDPFLSEHILADAHDAMHRLAARETVPRDRLRSIKFLLRSIGGARHVPRHLVWP